MRGRIALAALAISACGDGTELPDAGLGSDGPPRGLVSVHVEGRNGASDPVYFQTASSSIVLATRTNAEGDANALMPAGGFVSVVDENQGTVYTWTGVQPGDELVLDRSFVEQPSDVFPEATIRIDPMDGAFNYYLYSRCVAAREVSPAIDEPFAPFFEPCSMTTDLLLVAWGPTGPMGYRYRANANLLSATTIDLRGEYIPFTANVELIGPADRSIVVRQRLANLTYEIESSAQGEPGRVVVPMPMPVIPGTIVLSHATTSNFSFPFPEKDDALHSNISTIEWGLAKATTTLDLATPAIAELAGEPELELPSNILRWSQAEGSRGDVVWATLRAGIYRWVVIGAHTGETALRLPSLPRDDLRPNRETMFFENFAIIAAEGGYDRLRPYLLGHWSPSAFWSWPMMEPSGRVNYRSRF